MFLFYTILFALLGEMVGFGIMLGFRLWAAAAGFLFFNVCE